MSPAYDLTVDRLAARAGMTVRNVRAYAARGLLQPPRLVGRTGYYGEQHVERLLLVREMLADGYTLGAIEKSLSAGTSAAGRDALALRRALVSPWRQAEPYETDLATLSADPAVPPDGQLLQALTGMGLLELLGGGRVRVLDPGLLAAGVQVARLGVDPATVLDAQLQVIELVEQAAAVYVRMFRETVWRDFVAAGLPPDGWPAIQQTVEKLQPVAAQALLASFRTAMAEAVDAEVERVLPRLDT